MIWNTHTHTLHMFMIVSHLFIGKIQPFHQAKSKPFIRKTFFSHEQCKLVIGEISVCSPRNMFLLPWTIFQFPAEKRFIRWEHHCFIAKLRLSHHEILVIPPFLMVKSTIYQQFISQPWYISPICRRFSQRTKPPYSRDFPAKFDDTGGQLMAIPRFMCFLGGNMINHHYLDIHIPINLLI